MDFKDFHDGLLSLSLMVFIFSLTFMVGSISIWELLMLSGAELYYIIVLCLVNMGFSLYYLYESLKLKKIFNLYERHIVKFAKRIGIMTIGYSIHLYFQFIIIFMGFNNLQLLMIFLILIMELCLIAVVFREVYDVLFLNEAERELQLAEGRKRYLDPEKRNREK